MAVMLAEFDTNVISLIVLVVLALMLIAYSLMPRRRDDQGAVRRRLTGKRGADDTEEIRAQAKASATENIVRRATPVLSKLVMPTSDEAQSTLRLRLMNAGYRQPQAQTLFLASKSIVAVIGGIIGLIVGLSMHWQFATVATCALFGAGLGMMFPDFWLSMATSSRQGKIRAGMPDVLDLLVVSVESGLGLDAAFKRVGDEMACVHRELSDELRISTMEGQMGLPRSEALGNMARRTGLDEVRSLVSVIVQAEKFGTSIAKALRNQAESLRIKRRQKAEERAQKTAIKLMIPLILFIFPAMGVVLGGPALLNVFRALQDNPELGGG